MSGEGSDEQCGQSPKEARPNRCPTWAMPVAMTVIVVALIIVMVNVDMDKALSDFNDWLEENKLIGAFAYVAAYVFTFMAMVPSTPMELLGAYVFGFAQAFLILMVAKPLAYMCTFQAGRLGGLDRCGASLQKHAKLLKALERAMAKDPSVARQIVFFVCLSFLPAGVKTCGMAAISAVTLGMLLGCSFFASLPYTAANAWLGSSARDLQGLLDGSSTDQAPGARYVRIAVMLLGATGLLGSVTALGCYGRRALNQMAAEEEGAGEAHTDEDSPRGSDGQRVQLC